MLEFLRLPNRAELAIVSLPRVVGTRPLTAPKGASHRKPQKVILASALSLPSLPIAQIWIFR